MDADAAEVCSQLALDDDDIDLELPRDCEEGLGDDMSQIGSNGGKSTLARNRKTKGADGKSRRKAVNGMKYCPCCKKMLSIDLFPVGAGQCWIDKKAIQNIKNSAKAQNQEDWLAEVLSDGEKLFKVCTAYKLRTGLGQVKANGTLVKPKKFGIMKYREECLQEQAILLDGTYEMMDQRHYCAWMAKPKNGCQDYETSKLEWQQFHDAKDSITDKLGKSSHYQARVAIKKSDLLTVRDACIRRKGFEIADKEKRNGSEQDLLQMHAKMQKSYQFEAPNQETDRLKQGQMMVSAQAVLQAGGVPFQGALSAAGAEAAFAGDVKGLLEVSDEDEEDAEDKEAQEAKEAKESSHNSKRKSESDIDTTAGSAKKNKTEAFWARDDAIAAALLAHRNWHSQVNTNLLNLMQDMKATLKSIPPEIAADVHDTRVIVENRFRAVKLVFGKPWDEEEVLAQDAHANQPQDNLLIILLVYKFTFFLIKLIQMFLIICD